MDNNGISLCGKDRREGRVCQRIFQEYNVIEGYAPHVQEAWAFVFACAWHSYWEWESSCSGRPMTEGVLYHDLITRPRETIDRMAAGGSYQCGTRTENLQKAAIILKSFGFVLSLPEPSTPIAVDIETLRDFFNRGATGILKFENAVEKDHWSLVFAFAWHSYWEVSKKMPTDPNEAREFVKEVKKEELFFYHLTTDPIPAIKKASEIARKWNGPSQVEGTFEYLPIPSKKLARQLASATCEIMYVGQYLPLARPPAGPDGQIIEVETLCQLIDQDGMTGILKYT